MTELENKSKIWMSERDMKRMFALPRPAARALEELEKIIKEKEIQSQGQEHGTNAIRTS